MASEDSLSNAGISPRERLERIEQMLERIDGKLDGKANAAEVAGLEARIRELELNGSVHIPEMRAKVEALEVGHGVIQRKLAYATGTIVVVMVFVNWLLPQIKVGV